MPSDLTVGTITVVSPPASPPPVAPCPTPVDVEVVNLGPDPAPLPIDVCLQVSASSDGPFTAGYIVVTRDGEGLQLAKNASVTVRFMVSFPCGGQAWLRATADCLLKVPGNAHTNPSKTVPVSPLGAAPWLATEVRLGLRDSMGGTTWDPKELCPDATLVVEGKIRNIGCAPAPGSVTDMELTNPAGGVIASAKRVTPAIAAGTSTTVTFLTSIASPPLAPQPASVTATVTADSSSPPSVTGQCDRSKLSRSVTLPVSQPTAGTAPKVSFSVDGSIVPGQAPSVTWSIVNGCADLGAVRATIRFSGSVIYTSQVFPVAPFGTTGEQGVAIPKVTDPAIASAFNLIGTHTLDLRVDAFGKDPGPYQASATLTVKPDAVGPSWWTWQGPITTALWKLAFPVLGQLVNNGVASFTPVAINIRERPGPAPGTGAGVLTPADPFSKSPLPPGSSLTNLGLDSVTKSWSWTGEPDWSLSGPTSLSFVYTAEFDLNDEFGNVYSTVVSGTRTMTVTVGAVKLGFQTAANSQAIAAAGAAAFAAAVALANPVAAGVALELAFLMWGLSIWNGAKALDPPAPDFDYDERVELSVAPVRVPAEAGPAMVALGQVTELALRAQAAGEALDRIHRKLLGAWVNNATDALQAQADRYEEVLQILVRAASLLADIVGEAAEAVRQDAAFAPAQLEDAARRLRDDDVPAELRDAARQAGLPDDALPTLVQAAARLEAAPDLAALVGTLATALRTIADETQAAAPAILALARR
jgi:hypothetical protein